MLEKAVLRRNSDESNLAVSRLLDAMLYYGHVHLFLDLSGFLSLYDQLGAGDLRALMNAPGLTFEITAETNAIYSDTVSGRRSHMPTFIKAAFPGKGNSTIDIIADRVQRRERTPKPSRRLIEAIVHKGKQTKFEKLFGDIDGSYAAFFLLAQDVDTLKLAIAERARRLGLTIGGEALANIQIRTMRDANRILINSTPDIHALLGSIESGEHWAAILAIVQDYCIDLHLSQTRSADVIVSPQTADLSKKRNDLAIQRGLKSGALIADFESFVFDDEARLGAAYDGGAVTLKEALSLIDKGHQFRHWLSGVEPDEELIKEYRAAVERGTVLDTVPGRIARLALFGGVPAAIGLVNAGAGLVASGASGVFDVMFTDRIARGWRPNQYIDRVKQALKS